MVAEGWVLTNRHVVEAIIADMSERDEKNLDYWFLDWVHPDKNGGWSQIVKVSMQAAPIVVEGLTGLDVALIHYTHVENEMKPCKPVIFGRLDEIRIGADVAICGYLGGSDLLR